MVGINQHASLAQFKERVFHSEEHIKTLKNNADVVAYIEEQSKQLLSADVVMLLHKISEEKYRIVSDGRTYSVTLSQSSVLSEVISKKQPLLVKDVANSLLYRAEEDNLTEQSIKDVLVVPLQRNKSKRTSPETLLWAAVYKDSDTTLRHKQTLYLIKYLEALKHYIIPQDVSDDAAVTLRQCLEQNEEMTARIERNERYFHSIIHDVRTPMNALLGFLELLSLHEEDETKKNYLNSAMKSGEHIVRLINDALDVAKIESGELPVEKKAFDLHHELDDTIKIFFESANKKHLALCAYIDPKMPQKIVSDAYRIKQVLSNLLSNAIKFTSEGGSILVEAIYDKNEDTVTVAVEDTGKGIKKEALENIFTAYRQEDASTERQYGGTGLGLNISYQIVALLGGKLEVESEVGKGSRFYFTLPALSVSKEEIICPTRHIHETIRLYRWKGREDLRANTVVRYLENMGLSFKLEEPDKSLRDIYMQKAFDSDVFVIEKHNMFEYDYEYAQLLLDHGCRIIWFEDVFDVVFNFFKGKIAKVSYPILAKSLYDTIFDIAQNEKNTKEMSATYKGRRVLVVDDNRINLKFMDALLRKLEIEVTLLDNAKSALQELETQRYDVVFMDEQMPSMLGSEAIRILNEKIEQGAMEPTTLISLSGDSYNQEHIIKAGAHEVMVKPVKVDELHAVLDKYLASGD